MEGSFTLVYVEDDEFIREMLQDALSEHFSSAMIVAVGNRPAAQDAIEEAAVRREKLAVLTDLNYISNKDQIGLKLIMHVHAEYPSVPCILYTGNLSSDLRNLCMRFNLPVLEKPANRATLVDAVERACINGPGSGAAVPAAVIKSSLGVKYG